MSGRVGGRDAGLSSVCAGGWSRARVLASRMCSRACASVRVCVWKDQREFDVIEGWEVGLDLSKRSG